MRVRVRLRVRLRVEGEGEGEGDAERAREIDMRWVAMLVVAGGLFGCRDAGSEVARGGAEEGDPVRAKVYVDVRTVEEFAAGHLEGAIHIPVDEIGARWVELEPHRADSIIVYCRSGRRSAIALQVLEREGFEYLRNGGGLDDVRSGR